MKNKLRRIAAAAALCAGVCLTATGQTPPAITPDPEIEANIQKLLKKMTLDEKVGQMCEITIDVVTDFDKSRTDGFTLSEAKLDTVIGKYKVGSLLNVPFILACGGESVTVTCSETKAWDTPNR